MQKILNRKGQALVEFILILPILLIVLFLIIDFGRIFYTQVKLEGVIGEVADLYTQNKSYDDVLSYLKQESNSITINVDNVNDETIKITLNDSIKLSTPLLNTFMKNPYSIKVSRIVYDK